MTESSPAPDIFDLNQAEVVTGKEPKAETLSADVEQRPAKAKPASGVKDLVVKFMLGGAVVFGAQEAGPGRGGHPALALDARGAGRAGGGARHSPRRRTARAGLMPRAAHGARA